ncbi:hypothetical protein BGX31_011681 [Mortierella sp. GBA43]|nr:hypothetical protein BGX31_011681 [Mortierella sp. GBA43]
MASNGVFNTFLNRSRELVSTPHGLSAGTERPPNNTNNAQPDSGDLDDSIFKKPMLGVPPAPPPLKRKLSKNEANQNSKVYLRRLSNSSSGDMGGSGGHGGGSDNENSSVKRGPGLLNRGMTMPLSEKPMSSVDHDINTAHVPALVLAPFEPSPWLEFGKVLIGSKKTLTLVVQNPGDNTERLILDPNCKMDEKGFNISQLDPLQASTGNDSIEPIILPPRSKAEINICWTPLSAGIVRASAMLRSSSGRFMVNLRGHGDVLVQESPKSKSRRPSTATSRSTTTTTRSTLVTVRSTKQAGTTTSTIKSTVLKKSASMSMSTSTSTSTSTRTGTVRHAASKPEFTKPPTAAPGGYSTLPYVTTNEMYDEKWIDKQERSFSQWLNHEFNVTVDAFSADDPSSWSYYSHKLEFEHTRAEACKIYQSDMFKIVLRKVADSISRDRLQPRPDCNLVGDLGARRDIMDMLFSFDVRWLVLGLETITGKASSINPNFDRTTISGFISKALFHDQQTEAEFEPDRILSNRPKFIQAMNKLILKRLFMVILFLDKAKIARLIPSDPCLFNKSPLDEFDFTVRNLAVDLRDGVRLCRLIDLHCTEYNLCEKMKFPTLSKAHMQQNVNLALGALVKQGISLEGTRGGVVTPRDVVEGHREKTFGLLWKLVLNWKVAVLLDLDVLESEIAAVKTEYRRLYGEEQPDRVDTVYFTSDQLSALLRWCQAIGCFYGISVDNFTTSFSDARAFGALLSYYHPMLLNMNDMKDSGQFLEEYRQALRHTDMSNVGVPDEKAVILFITYLCARLMHLNKDIRAAKTIQRMWRKKHYGRYQEDRANAAVVLQRCIRRYLSRRRVHTLQRQRDEAATLIQTGCRSYLAQIRAINKLEDVIRLQAHFRMFLTRKHFIEIRWATLTIQRYYRGSIVRRWYIAVLTERRAVQMIQSQARGYLVRKELMWLRLAAEVVQSRWRANMEARIVQGHYLRVKRAAIVIQRQWRATIIGIHVREAYLQQREWAVKLQCLVRSKLTRHAFLEMQWAALVIQQRLRAYNETRAVQHQYLTIKWAAVVIQMRWRAVVARRVIQDQFQKLRRAVIVVQSVIRGDIVRARQIELQAAAVTIQRHRRALVKGRAQAYEFLQLRIAARIIQERWRALQLGRAERAHYEEIRCCIIGLQASIRGYVLRQRLIKVMQENQASMIIQATWHGYVQRQAFLQLRETAIWIQQRWRAIQQRRLDQHQYQEFRWGAIVIQQHWRAYKVSRDVRYKYLELRQSALTFQKVYRGMVARREVNALRTIVGIQAIVRMRFARWEFERLRAAALVMQQQWRARQDGARQKANYELTRHASTIIQGRWRAVLEGRKVREEYRAARTLAIAIQAHTRGAMARRDYQELRWAAGIVQEKWRARIQGEEQRRAYQEICMATRTIQTAWRSYELMQLQRHFYLELRWAAIVIQKRWRHVQYTRAMELEAEMERQAAAVLIQTAARGCLVRNRVRRHLEERERIVNQWIEVSGMSISAICIQRRWRRYQEQKQAALRESAAVTIQRWWRTQVEARQVHELEDFTLRMQTQIRGFLARRRADCQQRAILRLQAWWRGHVVRRESSAKIKAARMKIEHATATAEEHMKLGNRTTMALDILLSSGQLSSVLKACYHLDVVSRLSKNSRLRLVEHNVVNIIFQLIKSCNRSQPHMEVLKHGLNIIENLSLDKDTMNSVFWAPEGVEIIVDCAQGYRENEVVFESVVKILLIHLEQDERRRRAVKAMAPEVKKLKGVLTVMQRKVDRETRSKSLYSAPGKSVALLIQSVGKLRRIVELVQ